MIDLIKSWMINIKRKEIGQQLFKLEFQWVAQHASRKLNKQSLLDICKKIIDFYFPKVFETGNLYLSAAL